MSDLSTRIFEATHNNKDVRLTDQEQASLAALLGKRCNKQTKSRLEYKLSLPLYLYNDYGIYHRVSFDNGVAVFRAGQSYTDEIRVVRDLILDI